MHWGKEFATSPTTRQLRIAKYLHSLGVTAVIGAHPHVQQVIRKTKHKVIAYSLGNFLFPKINSSLTVRRYLVGCLDILFNQ